MHHDSPVATAPDELPRGGHGETRKKEKVKRTNKRAGRPCYGEMASVLLVQNVQTAGQKASVVTSYDVLYKDGNQTAAP